jgi:subtilisin-like proprotein convertase family protein
MKNSLISKFIFLAFTTLFLCSNSFAQEYILNNETNGTTIYTCSGTLYDSGGAIGSYQNGENYTITICSDSEDKIISLNFTQFVLESPTYDYMIIYDGNSIEATILQGPVGLSTLQGQTINATGDCITIKFVSDGNITKQGFAAEINCLFNCQDFTVSLNEFNPILLYPDSLMTDLCQGQEFTISTSASFPNNNILYNQSLETLEWHWVFSSNNPSTVEITTESSNELTYSFNSTGGYYYLKFYATDINGCVSSFNDIITFRVSQSPDFSQSLVSNEVCLGEPVTLYPAIVNDTAFKLDEEIVLFETICFGDFIGMTQTINLPIIHANPEQIITQSSDIQSVCMNIEHSYMGDLHILLECPNEQMVLLFTQACGSTYFGIPDHNDDCNPGIGYDYCWTMNAESQMNENCNPGLALPEGDYLPVHDFSNLIGCPINGLWKLSFIDNMGVDDGVLFSVSLNFAPGIFSEISQTSYFINSYDLSMNSEDVFWTGFGITPGILNQDVYPESAGDYDYILTATDNFGCTYDTTFTVTVHEIGNPCCGPFCNSMVYEDFSDTFNDGSGEYPSLNDTYCDWLISPSGKSDTDLFFYWNYFDVYEGDVLKIYAGNNDAAPLVFEFTNNEVPETFVIPGMEAYITYNTNSTLRSPGWELVYQTVPTNTNLHNNENVSIYPNPTSNNIVINGLKQATTIYILDMSGRIVKTVHNYKNETIDISDLASGMYYVKNIYENRIIGKITKQ